MKLNRKCLLSLIICVSLMMCTLMGCGKSEPAASSDNTTASTVKEESPEAETAEISEVDAVEESSEEAPSETAVEEGYGYIYFQVGDYAFSVKSTVDDLIAAVGEPMDTFVTSSCAYQGDDYMYYFDGFEVVANTDEEGVQRLTSITLDDDTVKTPQGVKIGMSMEDALALMPADEAEVNNNVYTFVCGYAMLRLQFGNDNCVKAIQYMLANQ